MGHLASLEDLTARLQILPGAERAARARDDDGAHVRVALRVPQRSREIGEQLVGESVEDAWADST